MLAFDDLSGSQMISQSALEEQHAAVLSPRPPFVWETSQTERRQRTGPRRLETSLGQARLCRGRQTNSQACSTQTHAQLLEPQGCQAKKFVPCHHLSKQHLLFSGLVPLCRSDSIDLATRFTVSWVSACSTPGIGHRINILRKSLCDARRQCVDRLQLKTPGLAGPHIHAFLDYLQVMSAFQSLPCSILLSPAPATASASPLRAEYLWRPWPVPAPTLATQRSLSASQKPPGLLLLTQLPLAPYHVRSSQAYPGPGKQAPTNSGQLCLMSFSR